MLRQGGCIDDRESVRISPIELHYWHLSQKLAETDDLDSREALLQAAANGSVVSWQHINLLDEYDFSDDKLRDSVGIKPQKLAA